MSESFDIDVVCFNCGESLETHKGGNANDCWPDVEIRVLQCSKCKEQEEAGDE